MPPLRDGREAVSAGSGRSLIEEYARNKAERGLTAELAQIVGRLEIALQGIATGKWKGYERSHAGRELREMREEARGASDTQRVSLKYRVASEAPRSR